jgi:hypothetical protein
LGLAPLHVFFDLSEPPENEMSDCLADVRRRHENSRHPDKFIGRNRDQSGQSLTVNCMAPPLHSLETKPLFHPCRLVMCAASSIELGGTLCALRVIRVRSNRSGPRRPYSSSFLRLPISGGAKTKTSLVGNYISWNSCVLWNVVVCITVGFSGLWQFVEIY